MSNESTVAEIAAHLKKYQEANPSAVEVMTAEEAKVRYPDYDFEPGSTIKITHAKGLLTPIDK
ncbi:MAG TPA: hypothetical protein VIJ14_08915 [Rhabdochlamydiaceae bacterium]